MSFQPGGALDAFAAVAGGHFSGQQQQQQYQAMNSYGADSRIDGYDARHGAAGCSVHGNGGGGGGGQAQSQNGPPTPDSSSHEGEQQQQSQQAHSFQLPVHTVQMQMPMQHSAPSFQAPATAPAPVQAPAQVQAPEPQAEEAEVEVQQPRRARRTKERIRRIHLPVREGMDELSSSEGSGSEWDEPVLAPGQKLPPGYTGKRRVKKPQDGKIKPAYYYPTEGSTRGVPVFEPTYEEFKDFNS